MAETETQRERVKQKVAASQDRLKREGATPPRKPAAPRKPRGTSSKPETLAGMATEHPFLTLAGGIAVGALLGSLLPRVFGGRFGKRAIALASVAGELGLAYGKQAFDAAGEAAHEGREKLGEFGETFGENASDAGHRAARLASGAASTARTTGLSLARRAVKLAASARR